MRSVYIHWCRCCVTGWSVYFMSTQYPLEVPPMNYCRNHNVSVALVVEWCFLSSTASNPRKSSKKFVFIEKNRVQSITWSMINCMSLTLPSFSCEVNFDHLFDEKKKNSNISSTFSQRTFSLVPSYNSLKQEFHALCIYALLSLSHDGVVCRFLRIYRRNIWDVLLLCFSDSSSVWAPKWI